MFDEQHTEMTAETRNEREATSPLSVLRLVDRHQRHYGKFVGRGAFNRDRQTVSQLFVVDGWKKINIPLPTP